jgi:hypothetical protein
MSKPEYHKIVHKPLSPRRRSYDFKDMKPGDSALFKRSEFKRAINAARRIGVRRGWSFTYSHVDNRPNSDVWIGRLK